MLDKLLKCPKCGSNNVVVQVASETKSEKQKHGCLWWLLIGWWLELVLWIFLTVPRLLIALFMPKRQKITTSHKSVAVCQNCGGMFDPQEVLLTKTETKPNISSTTSDEKWYEKTGVIILMLILFFPIGLYLMWKYNKTWSTTTKVIISVFFGLVFIGRFNSKTSEPSQTTSKQQTEVKKEVSNEPVITSTPTPTSTNQQSQTKEREAFISACLMGASKDVTRKLCGCNYDIAKGIWSDKEIVFGKLNEKYMGSSATKAKLQEYLGAVLSDCGGM